MAMSASLKYIVDIISIADCELFGANFHTFTHLNAYKTGNLISLSLHLLHYAYVKSSQVFPKLVDISHINR